jgi:hypothetical protein
MGDEISGGAGPAPRRTRTALLVLVAVAVVVAGVVSLRRGVQEPLARPPASPPVVQMPPLPGQVEPAAPTGPLPPVLELSLGQVCQPVRTDGRTTLDVSFTLVNTVDRPVTLVRVTPSFPLPGLRARSTEIHSGSCTTTGRTLTGGAVPGRGTVLVILRLGLLGECPTPLPVEATVTERRVGGRVVTGNVRLLNDLGTLYFTSC